MIRHVVLMTLKRDAPPDAAQNIVDGLKGLVGVVPSIRDYQAGVDLGLAPGNAAVAATADFDDVAGYLEFRNHPEHRAVIERYIEPFREHRAAIQFEL